jgi:hypothetical protein
VSGLVQNLWDSSYSFRAGFVTLAGTADPSGSKISPRHGQDALDPVRLPLWNKGSFAVGGLRDGALRSCCDPESVRTDPGTCALPPCHGRIVLSRARNWCNTRHRWSMALALCLRSSAGTRYATICDDGHQIPHTDVLYLNRKWWK